MAVIRDFEVSGLTMDRLRDVYPDIRDRLDQQQFGRAVGVVTYASGFLTRLLLTDAAALDVLTDLDRRSDCDARDVESLVRWKRLELLRIAARDLLTIDALEAVGYNLARLGHDVLQASAQLAGVDDQLAIIGMGKLGGAELNYSSDIDVMFVGDCHDSAARDVMEIARKCFRVDAALRPEGRDGALVRSLDFYQRYWAEYAQTWEFQALLKARPLTGPNGLQEQWAAASQDALWSHSFAADQLRELREMKARVESIISRRGLDEREVKRGRGGIRDIEFAVQLLQLVHGATDTHIRSATTLTALNQLADGGYIAVNDAEDLSSSYRFLRAIEHRLQLIEEEQTHTIPTGSGARSHLAATMGYEGANARSEFDQQLRDRQATVRHAHEKLYFRPLLEAFAVDDVRPGSPAETQLSAFGFRDAARTRTAVQELTKGLARSSRLMQQLMPLLFDWLSSAPDPDEGLLGLRKLISGFRTPTHIVNVFRDSPEVARRLCLLLGTGRMFSRDILAHPEVLDDLGDDSLLIPTDPFVDRMRVALSWRHDSEARHDALIRLARAERLRIACADVLGLITDAEALARRSQLADAALTLALEDINPTVPIAIIALGRYGGDELGYGSDLDIVVIHDGHGAADQHEAEVVAQKLVKSIGADAKNHLYAIDYSLRPEGRKGLLARSIESCLDYYAHWASTWERQALVRARFAAGSYEVAEKFLKVTDSFVWAGPLTADELKEVRHLKARMERERIPRGGDPEFHLKLGAGSLSDVEWTTQLLQLQTGLRQRNTIAALNELVQTEALDVGDARTLETAWRFCDFARNRLYIVDDGSGDALPADLHTLAVLARSLQVAELRDKYLQVTRRSRAVAERLFYGQEA